MGIFILKAAAVQWRPRLERHEKHFVNVKCFGGVTLQIHVVMSFAMLHHP